MPSDLRNIFVSKLVAPWRIFAAYFTFETLLVFQLRSIFYDIKNYSFRFIHVWVYWAKKLHSILFAIKFLVQICLGCCGGPLTGLLGKKCFKCGINNAKKAEQDCCARPSPCADDSPRFQMAFLVNYSSCWILPIAWKKVDSSKFFENLSRVFV